MSRPAFCEHLKVLASIAWIATASGASERKAWWSPVLLAKQHQGDTGPAQLVMDVGPIGLCLGPGALLTVVTAYRIASSTRSVRPADAARCNVSPTVLRARLSDRTIARSVAATFVLEAQNLPYSTHRHSLVWHRSPRLPSQRRAGGRRPLSDRAARHPRAHEGVAGSVRNRWPASYRKQWPLPLESAPPATRRPRNGGGTGSTIGSEANGRACIPSGGISAVCGSPGDGFAAKERSLKRPKIA